MDVNELTAQLQRERDQARRRLEEFTATREELAASRGDADGDDEHDPEGSTVAWEGATAEASVNGVTQHLEEIEAALARLDAGWDGTCTECGQVIPAERLMARPSADRCVPCASSK